MTDDDRAAQIDGVSAALPHGVSDAQIAKYAAARAKMTDVEKEA